MSGNTADLVVVGAGAMGAWTALTAARAGRSTVLLDAFGPGNSRSTSGDETRILRASHGQDRHYPVWAREAREAWRRLGEDAGDELYVESGVLWLARRPDAFEAESERTLATLGIPTVHLVPSEIAARWPGVAVDDLAFGLYEPEAGYLLARRGVQAAARAAAGAGATIRLGSARPGRASRGRLLDVELAGGERIAGEGFVFACGPWLPDLFPDVIGDLIHVTRQDVPWFGLPPGDPRFVAPRFPAWIDHDVGAYGVGSVEGRGFKCASDLNGPAWDPTVGDRTADPAAIDQARAYLARRFPPLAGAPVSETRVCQYESTPDAELLIDRHPTWSNAWLVGGGSGHGFKHGPPIGRHVVELLDGAAPEARFGLARRREPRAVDLRPGAAAVG